MFYGKVIYANETSAEVVESDDLTEVRSKLIAHIQAPPAPIKDFCIMKTCAVCGGNGRMLAPTGDLAVCGKCFTLGRLFLV